MPRLQRAARAHLGRCLAVVAGVAAAAASAAPAGAGFGPAGADAPEVTGSLRIAGGSQIAITSAPWQVRLRLKLNQATGICGGSIIDERHIITAAHCTYDDSTPLASSDIVVVSGSSSFNPNSASFAPNGTSPPDQPVTSAVSAIRRHPGYVLSSSTSANPYRDRDDVAILTLAAPLALDGIVRQAIALPERNTDLASGTDLSFSGFGVQSEITNALDGRLRRLTDMRALDAVTRIGELNAIYVIATSNSGLGCSGDSGGPLVTGSGPAAVLVGVLSFGEECVAGNTTVFTKVSPGEILDFVNGSDAPPPAPTGGRDVLLTADKNGALPLRPGRVLTCSPGTWTHNPAITVSFFEPGGAVLQEGPSRTYVVATADVGKRIGCRAVASNDGGVGRTPATTSTPEVENPLPATAGSVRARAKLSVTLRARRREAFRGESVGLTIRLYSRASTAAINAQACVTVPKGWRVVRRGGAKVSGNSVCLKTRTLRQYELVYTTISLRPGSKAKTGTTKIKVRAAADNAAAAFSSRTFRVF